MRMNERRTFLGGSLALGASALMPRLTAAASRPFVSDRISVAVTGDGPDVVLIHGLGSAAGIWDDVVRAVPGYRFHLVQIAGFAGVPPRGNAQGRVVADTAAAVARYIASARLKKPALIGHSMGGTIAMMIASQHPKSTGRVMVVDMLPAPAGLMGMDAGSAGPIAAQLAGVAASPAGRRVFDALAGIFGGGKALTSDYDVTTRALGELARIDLSPDLPKIRAPLTVVYATPDPQGFRSAERITARFKSAYAPARKARLIEVPHSGHMIMYDQPKRFEAVVRAFLQRD